MPLTPSDSSVSSTATAFCSNQLMHQGQRQVVDAAVEGLGQGDGDLDRAVGVVALAHVHQARQAEVLAVVVIADAELAAAEGQDKGIARGSSGVVAEVVAPGFGAVAAADDEEVADLARP